MTWDAKPVKNEDANSSAGSPLPTPGQEGFLILKCPITLTKKAEERLKAMAEEAAAGLGLKAIVVADGMDASVVPAGFGDLVKAIASQTAAITRLAMSNEMLIQAMAEAEGMDENRPAAVGLNGRPL